MTVWISHINRSCHLCCLFSSSPDPFFFHSQSNYCALSCDMAFIWFHHLAGMCVFACLFLPLDSSNFFTIIIVNIIIIVSSSASVKKILRAINEIMCWIGCIKYMSRTTSKDSIYLCMSMCKKTLSIFGSGSSFFAIACFLFWARFFLRYIARFYSLVPLLTWIWVCVYLFSQYFLSPFFFDFFLFLKRQPAPRTNGE